MRGVGRGSEGVERIGIVWRTFRGEGSKHGEDESKGKKEVLMGRRE
jgi:hypothetical protein